MSAMQLSRGHLEILAITAAELGIAQVRSDQGRGEGTADAPSTRGAFLFELLEAQHSLMDASPDASRVPVTEERPNITDEDIGRSAWEQALGGSTASKSSPPLRGSWKTDPQQCVQLIQWVRCYVYQCSSDQRWRGSAAESICTQMISGLLDLLAVHFRSSWVP